MLLENMPFAITDFAQLAPVEYPGEQGKAVWRTMERGNVRVRIVEYSPGYKADHWCSRGHVVFVLQGELTTELRDGRRFVMKPGMSYQVSDGAEAHRSITESGATLFVVD
jgi:quercetin dioxygenase-like cupin family protein